MKKEEDLPSSQQLSEVNDALINERPSEEPSFNDGRVDVYLNVRLNTNKFVINCKDDEEEREKPFPSENKEDFTVSFSTTRQRCLIPTSGEGKRYAFHCRSTDDVPKFILTNLPPCCISVKVSMYFMSLLYICNCLYVKHELLLRINAHAPIQVARTIT
jgi:hypothetical protein